MYEHDHITNIMGSEAYMITQIFNDTFLCFDEHPTLFSCSNVVSETGSTNQMSPSSLLNLFSLVSLQSAFSSFVLF